MFDEEMQDASASKQLGGSMKDILDIIEYYKGPAHEQENDDLLQKPLD